jgi:hypothetical protein
MFYRRVKVNDKYQQWRGNMYNEDDQKKGTSKSDGSSNPRDKIALWMLAGSLAIIFGTSIALIYNTKDFEKAERIFMTLLPVLATWVGTILAFYFSRENFESASKEMRGMFDKLSPMDKKLASILVKAQMLSMNEIEFFKMPAGGESKTTIKDLVSKLNDYSRLPVVGHNSHPKYIIHRSTLFEYIADEMMSGKTKEIIYKLTLEEVLNTNSDIKKTFSSTFVTIRPEANLLEANNKMKAKHGSQDIFVTNNGTKDEPMIGWITNVILLKNASE